MSIQSSIRIDRVAPVADGICFDDLYAFTEDAALVLTARGLVWATIFGVGDRTYCGTVIAKNWNAAAEIADARGLGEVVVGQRVGRG